MESNSASIRDLKTSLPGILSCTDLKKESANSLCGPCPKCGGNDRFVYKTDTGKCWCRQCRPEKESMDIIDFHAWLKGISNKNFIKGASDSIPKPIPKKEKARPIIKNIVAYYPYINEAGDTLSYCVRFEEPGKEKTFRQWQKKGDAWIQNIQGVRRVLYNLPAVIKNQYIIIVEGEKDADNLIKLGFTATTNPSGVKNWRPEFTPFLKNKNVVILPDNDTPGREHAESLANNLIDVAELIRVVNLPGLDQKGDVSDWINAGGTIEKLRVLIKATDPYKKKNSTNIINGLDLFKKEFNPIKWAVHNILAEGCSILAGKPKCGKSIFALNICIAVAAGTKAFSSIDVEPGPVLYLALEDVQRRLKSRLKQMLQGDDPTALKNLHLATDWPKMGEGGLKKLDETIKEIPNIRLVIIDTLKMIRPVIKGNKSLYDSDYEPISAIKKIADKHCVSILLIHHLRKSDADDIFDTLSGSLGLTGATDTNLILERQTGNVDATLHINGRDVESAEYAMRFQPGNMSWRILGAAQDIKSTDERQKLFDAIKNADKPLSPKKIETLTNLKPHYIRKTLPLLITDGSIKKEGRGQYIYNVGNNGNNGYDMNNTPERPQKGLIVPGNNAGYNAGNNCKPLNNKGLEGNVPIVPIVPIPCNDCKYTDKPGKLCCYLAMTGKPGKMIPVDLAALDCPLEKIKIK